MSNGTEIDEETEPVMVEGLTLQDPTTKAELQANTTALIERMIALCNGVPGAEEIARAAGARYAVRWLEKLGREEAVWRKQFKEDFAALLKEATQAGWNGEPFSVDVAPRGKPFVFKRGTEAGKPVAFHISQARTGPKKPKTIKRGEGGLAKLGL